MSIEAISKRVVSQYKKALSKIGVEVIVYKPKLNEFKESEGFEKVCSFRGIVSKSNVQINKTSTDKGSVKRLPSLKIQCIIDENSKAVTEGDLLEVNGVKYSVIDISDVNMLGALYDIVVRKI